MPRSRREELLRLHAQSMNDIDRGLGNMQRMVEIYAETGQHDQYANYVKTIAAQLATIQEIWLQYRYDAM